MKLSCKSQYAIRALFDLAYHGSGAPIKIEAIAKREEISPRFLEQIFKDLKKAGLITSKRGPKGGYFLAKRPDQISLGEIILLLEGSLDESLERSGSEEACGPPPSVQVTHDALVELADQVTALFNSVSLQDLVQRGERAGVQREGYKGFIYVI